MNLPNKLTMLRVIMIPFFVFFLLFSPYSGNMFTFRLIADLIFIAASLTDMLDGKIARKYNLITNFGKFMDPLADKLLVCSAMICLTGMGKYGPAGKMGELWVIAVLIIIAREFIISGFRLIAAADGIVIAANMWGKSKTVSQMLMVIVLILDPSWIPAWFDILLVLVATVLTVISLVTYIWQNRKVLSEQD